MADPQPRRGFQTPREVTDYFDQKGLRPAFSWQDVWGEEHAYAFTVAKATELELLTAFKTSIGAALAKGQSFETWRAGLMPTLARLGWAEPRTVVDPTGQAEPAEVAFSSPARLRTIFWSNMNSARSAGQWERAQRSKAALPYVLYVRTASADPRPEHLGWVGTILHLDDPWWQTHWPPNGWGCKCSVRQVTARERDRLLATPAAPGGIAYAATAPNDGPPKTFINARTGQVSEVPAGIDPGWGGNPGLNRARTLMTRVTQRLDEAGEDDARAAVQAIVTSDVPRVLLNLPETVFMPVAIAPPQLVDELGAKTKVVMVSNSTMRVKADKHGGDRPVTPEAFAEVQKLLDEGTMLDDGVPRHRVFGSKLWMGIVKATRTGLGLILSSLHGINDRQWTAIVKRAAERKERK